MPARSPIRLLLAMAGFSTLALAAIGSGSAAVASSGRVPVIFLCGGSHQARPANVVLTCADANWGLQHLRWAQWGARRTVAIGVEYANTCKPNCADGHFVHFGAKVIAYRLDATSGTSRYTRLQVFAPRRPPAHLPQVATFLLKTTGPVMVTQPTARPALLIGGGILPSPSSRDAYLVNLTIAPATGDFKGPVWVTACSQSVCNLARGGGSLPIVNVPFQLGHRAAGTHVTVDVAACSAGYSCVRAQFSGVVPKS